MKLLPIVTIATVIGITASSIAPANAQWWRRRPTNQPVQPTQPAPQTGNFQQQILSLVNIERSKAGLQPLTLNSQLNQAAQNHTNDMISKRYFSHTSPSGSTMTSRVNAVGYRYSTIGENIAAGNATAAGTMTQWMNSPGHRANILNPNFKELGVGYGPSNDQYRHYWTQVFGAAR
jgi:serralysin